MKILPQSNTPPGTKPVAPLQLDAPKDLPSKVGAIDLKTMSANELYSLGRKAAGEGDYPQALKFHYWYAQKSKKGEYDLACYYSQCGQIDAAYYYLQLAAMKEGVDSGHAESDGDLANLRRDPRWKQVRPYLIDCNRYFETARVGRTPLVLPKGYAKGTPIPVVMWLHGLGSRPDDFIDGSCQGYADDLNVAFVGVSGTKPRGPNSFVWAEEPEKDAERMRVALAEIADRVTIEPGHVITFGFSQGAQVGLDVAVRYPDVYAGSIVLSPGADSHLAKVQPSPLLMKRGFVVSCAAKEHPGNVQLAAMDADWLRKANAQVIHKAYPNATAHALPADFDERFPEWIRFILKARGK